MVLFIASETAVFACFLASYYYLRFIHRTPWPPAGDPLPHLFWATLGTAVLVASALPLFAANRAAARERSGGAGALIVVVWLMGAFFMLAQFLDWTGEYPSTTLSKDAYGSLFYTLAGLHLAHIVLGLFMLINLIARALPVSAGHLRKGPLGVVSMYWYFLVVIGVAIYLTLYLFPRSSA
jgi:heme/copper-type cytochrome/quinol oxidase subunit 3